MMKKRLSYMLKINILLIALVHILLFIRCQNITTSDLNNTDSVRSNDFYRDLLISLDTLSYPDRSALLHKTVTDFEKIKDFEKLPYYWILKSFRDRFSIQRDSILTYLAQINTSQKNPDVLALKEYLKLNGETAVDDMNSAELMEEIISKRNKIEQSKSVFVYLLDDLLAMGFYTNHNPQKALLYTEEYVKHHPLSNNIRMKQRYYDIRFMLSQKLKNGADMKNFLDSCRQLAIRINDSTALMRTYDYEAQLYSFTGRPDQAVKSLRKFFNYLKSKDKLQFYVFNNLAKSFLDNGQMDSTIKYLKWSEEWGKGKKKDRSQSISELDMISEAYMAKGDYKKALLAKNKQYTEFRNSVHKIQQEKIAEINTRYETQKKDKDIQMLQETNILNNRVLVQQRWLFVILFLFLIMILFFSYKMYKKKLLEIKHNQLLMENQQYVLEQKNRQNQLNPHFIYNSIANLQGLIGADKKLEANKYLVALTKLIRDILELNRKDFISLDHEVKSLQNYIDLQQMRFSESFDYLIDTGGLDLEDILIPPMLVQPFVENAIEYGLKNITYRGLLVIKFFQENQRLVVLVEDNGLGLQEQQGEINKESLSQVITMERLAFLYGTENGKAELKISPNFSLNNTGYKIELYLPLKQKFN